MIVAERKQKANLDMLEQFEENITDGRLTVPSDGKTYRLREAILLSKRLGRPLSQDEMKKIEV